jgi:proteasome lid subunit RPN8/RPN11
MNDELIALVPYVRIHAEAEAPRECCGLAVRDRSGLLVYVACRNVARDHEHFIINATDYARAEDTGEVVAIAHSHPYMDPAPSLADRTSIEDTGLPWLIVNHPLGTYTISRPEGFAAPLIGRPFVHGVHDCYALVRDYFAKIGITLNDYARSWGWWEGATGPDLYRDNFMGEGFREVPPETLREHDLILMRIRAPRENHMAVYLGHDVILHHLIGQPSRRETYQEFYQRRTTAVLRHCSFM